MVGQLKTTGLMAAVLAFAALNVQAEEAKTATTTDAAKSTVKIEDVKADKNKVDGDIDQEITNARMRADAGSKSKWSVSASMQYLGGTIRKPFDKDRANPTNLPVPEKVNMSGDVSVRYRLSKSLSMSAGTGVSVVRPLQEAKKGNVSNPYLAISSAYKAGDIQNISTAQVTVVTDSDERENGQVTKIGLSQTAVTDFGGSRFSAGLAIDGTYYTFDKNSALAQAQQNDYDIGIYPFAEYAFTDMFQLRTVTRPWIFYHSRTKDELTTMAKADWTQSLGLTIVASRDIYFYPNFQWKIEEWREAGYNWFRNPVADTTTVGVSANLNVF